MAYLNPMPVSRGRTPAYYAQAKRVSGEAWEALSRLAAGLEEALGVRPETRAVLGGAAAVIQGPRKRTKGRPSWWSVRGAGGQLRASR
jgi:hypothetical protein